MRGGQSSTPLSFMFVLWSRAAAQRDGLLDEVRYEEDSSERLIPLGLADQHLVRGVIVGDDEAEERGEGGFGAFAGD